jgi:hypothetical protein
MTERVWMNYAAGENPLRVAKLTIQKCNRKTYLAKGLQGVHCR